MARIPQTMFSQTISTDVGGAPRSGGISKYDGLQDFAEGITKLGVGASNLIEAREKAKREDYISTSKANFGLEYAEYKVAKDKEFHNTGYDGYADDQQKFINEKRDFYLKEAPDAHTQEIINHEFSSLKADALIKDSAYENKKKSEYYALNQEQNIDKVTTRLQTSGDVNDLAKELQEARLTITNSPLHDIPKKRQLLEKTNDMALATISGMIDRGGKSLYEAKSFLEGKHPLSEELLTGMAPNQREVLKNKADREIKLSKFQAFSSTTTEIENSIASLDHGTVTPQKISTLKAQVAAVSNIDPEFKTPYLDSLVNKATSSLTVATIKEQELKANPTTVYQKLLAEKSRDVTTELDATKKQAAIHAYEAVLKEKLYDPGGASLKMDSKLVEGTTAMKKFIEGWGGDSSRVYSREREKALFSEFTNSTNPLVTLQEFMQEAQAKGEVEVNKNWIKSASKREKGLAKYAQALDHDDPIVQNYILMTPAEKLTIHNEYNALVKMPLEDKKIGKDIAAHPAFDALRDSRAGMDEGAGYSAIQDAAIVYVKDTLAKQRGMTYETAVKQAAELMVAKNYGFVTSGNRTIPLNATYKEHQNVIQEFITSYNTSNLSSKDLEKLKWDPSPYLKEGSRNKDVGQLLNTLRNQGHNLRFELSKDEEHLQIVYDKPLAGKTKVNTGYTDMDGNKKVKPLEIPLKDIINGVYKKPERTSMRGR